MLDGGIRVVDGNLGSALILEDDADWDIRIKKQLQAYALSSRKGFASAFGPMARHRMQTPRSSRPTNTMTYRMILILTGCHRPPRE